MRLLKVTILALLCAETQTFSVRDMYKGLTGLNSFAQHEQPRTHKRSPITLLAQTAFMDDVENEIASDSDKAAQKAAADPASVIAPAAVTEPVAVVAPVSVAVTEPVAPV